jgi:hypothetical protein
LSAVRRERALKAAVLAGSAAGHALVFALIGLNVPQVRERVVAETEQAMIIDLFRPPPPPRARRADAPAAPKPQVSAVRPRTVTAPAPSAVPPLPMAAVPGPVTPAPAPKTGAGSGGTVPGPGQDLPGGDLRQALRGSTVGCANRGAVGLNRREVDRCDERLGAGAAQAPWIAAPMDATKRSAFDAEARRKEIIRQRKAAAPPVGVTQGNAGGTRTDGIGILDH